MGDQLISSVVTVLTGITALAVIAVLVSRNANTSGVITAGATGFAKDLEAAVSPVSGGFGGFTGGGAGLMY